MDEPPKNRRILAEIAGWYGMSAIVLGYLLVSFNILPAGGGAYQLLNLTGALGILVISIVKKIRQTIILNIFWGAIAVIALARAWLR
jgi:hypothetical protein